MSSVSSGRASQPFFTVLTPTFNRAHTLPKVYQSLLAQTLADFEWLIVDDGSSDKTSELVSEWIRQGILSIRYIAQPNQGKHVAFNSGVLAACGKLLVPLDSDDECVSDALERFRAAWLEIPWSVRDQFSGISCLCKDRSGRVVGSAFSAEQSVPEQPDVAARQWGGGERWGCHRTDVLRNFLYPVVAEERFVPEGLVWMRIARRYRIRFINEPLRIYEQYDDGLSARGASLRIRNPRGSALYYSELSQPGLTLIRRLAGAANYVRFSLHAGLGLASIVREAPSATIAVLASPIGVVAYCGDKARSA